MSVSETPPSGWEGILREGESILWQGRPDSMVFWSLGNIFTTLFGLAFAGFAFAWMRLAYAAGADFWMFGLVHFTAGALLALGPPIWSAWRRRHTWYTLTDRRAFIATDIPTQGRKLKAYPIDEQSFITFEPGPPDTVYFDAEYESTKNGSRRIPIGFERIRDGARVNDLLLDVQRKRANT